MNIVQDIKPLSTFKRNTAEIIKHIKETQRPTIITINGSAEVVVQDAESYQSMLDTLEYLRNVQKIQQGLTELKDGKAIPAKKALADFRKKHHLL
ncbi:MAG: type II toxin-antitoxin system Phd/YefM family antitoxin [Candidatus Margulisbacteria bacterium]|jgi:prevent-host-death family protein|nr:type II toxin-antitoxin system Phd/YefM family antitoxin [Candidatus Margulisiibacteriota bacterium]